MLCFDGNFKTVCFTLKFKQNMMSLKIKYKIFFAVVKKDKST